MLKNLQKEGFASIVEVIVTAVIFVIASFGIFATISNMRMHGAESTVKLEATYVGKGIIDQLMRELTANVWHSPTSNLAVGTYNRMEGNYMINYVISDVSGLNLRKLVMNVTFPDLL